MNTTADAVIAFACVFSGMLALAIDLMRHVAALRAELNAEHDRADKLAGLLTEAGAQRDSAIASLNLAIATAGEATEAATELAATRDEAILALSNVVTLAAEHGIAVSGARELRVMASEIEARADLERVLGRARRVAK